MDLWRILADHASGSSGSGEGKVGDREDADRYTGRAFHSDVGFEVTYTVQIFDSSICLHSFDAIHGVSPEEPRRRGEDPKKTTPKIKVSSVQLEGKQFWSLESGQRNEQARLSRVAQTPKLHPTSLETKMMTP